ncbi:hypothetical protein EON65_55770 [archaeon]|nr:MAG: hypothetical protein EON65_55770 [archaeon]
MDTLSPLEEEELAGHLDMIDRMLQVTEARQRNMAARLLDDPLIPPPNKNGIHPCITLPTTVGAVMGLTLEDCSAVEEYFDITPNESLPLHERLDRILRLGYGVRCVDRK